MKQELSPADIERRFAKINARPAEPLTDSDALSLAEAEAMDDGSTVTLEELQQELEAYSGRIVLRIPRSLHKELKDRAALEGVSLNQYMLFKLSH